jgi:hypothetical protein
MLVVDDADFDCLGYADRAPLVLDLDVGDTESRKDRIAGTFAFASQLLALLVADFDAR